MKPIYSSILIATLEAMSFNIIPQTLGLEIKDPISKILKSEPEKGIYNHK